MRISRRAGTRGVSAGLLLLCAALAGLAACAPRPREGAPGNLLAATAAEVRTTAFGHVYDSTGMRRRVTADEILPTERASRFGMLTTDSTGAPIFEAVTEVPHVANATVGWILSVGESTRPVQWKEVLAGPLDGGAAAVEPAFPAALQGETVPLGGFIYHQRVLAATAPPGRYSLTVTLGDGRREEFTFVLRPPRAGEESAEPCPYLKTYLNQWRREDAEGTDPGGRDLSEGVMALFARTLFVEHGFEAADDVNDAYWKVDTVALQSMKDPSVAHGLIHMRTFADFIGRAVRTSHGVPGELIDYQLLFEQPVVEMPYFTRRLADDFAAKLLPHARHMCRDWSTGQLEEEARLERVREELTDEIKRIRKERAELEQRKRLKLEIEEESAEPSSGEVREQGVR